MRVAFLLLLFAGVGVAQPPAKKLPAMPKLPKAEDAPVGSLSPAGQLRAAALDMATRVPAIDQANVRYISLYACPADKLPTWTVLLRFALNTVSLAPDIVHPFVVPDTGGRLFRVNVKTMRWTPEAFSAVARRDPYFREPMLPHRETEFLRQTIGIQQDPKTFAAEAIVDGLFLMRDILQPEGRSDTYYDLLYAEQRFGKSAIKPTVVEPNAIPADPGPEPQLTGGKPWRGGIYTDGKFYKAGEFLVWTQEELDAHAKRVTEWKTARLARESALAGIKPSVVPGGIKKNFPEDLKQWEEFWGVEGAEKFAKDRGFLIQNGEVVAGARNVRGGKGSFVAFNDRVIVVTPVPTGYHLETYDSVKTERNKDFLENPLNVVDGKIESDAGELLVNLPNGLQAALLVAGGKRVDFADSRVARNTADTRDVTVRTQIGCVQCHGVDNGYISPTNRKLRESIEAGLKLNVKNEDDRDKIKAFFLDWEEKEAAIRAKMATAYRKLTAKPGDAKDKGWTGAQIVAVMMDFRDWYDDPVTITEAALHLGADSPSVFVALTISPTAGLNLVAVGKGMPRSAWDTTGALEAGQLLTLFRQLPFQMVHGMLRR